MARKYTAKRPARMALLDVFPDGSGATALINVGPFRYVVDYMLGEIRVRAVSIPPSLRREKQIAISSAVALYKREVLPLLPPEWVAMHFAMYAGG